MLSCEKKVERRERLRKPDTNLDRWDATRKPASTPKSVINCGGWGLWAITFPSSDHEIERLEKDRDLRLRATYRLQSFHP